MLRSWVRVPPVSLFAADAATNDATPVVMISFIIPAHNEEALLGRTLAALHAAAGKVGDPYEIVVVNDGSTDGTGEIAVKQAARVVLVNHRQISATRNAGASAAMGD